MIYVRDCLLLVQVWFMYYVCQIYIMVMKRNDLFKRDHGTCIFLYVYVIKQDRIEMASLYIYSFYFNLNLMLILIVVVIVLLIGHCRFIIRRESCKYNNNECFIQKAGPLIIYRAWAICCHIPHISQNCSLHLSFVLPVPDIFFSLL